MSLRITSLLVLTFHDRECVTHAARFNSLPKLTPPSASQLVSTGRAHSDAKAYLSITGLYNGFYEERGEGMADGDSQKSMWARIFGRSLLRAVIGDFFADKNNAASVIAIMLVATLCYVVAIQGKYEFTGGLLNIVFVVIGYYFGSKREAGTGDGDTP